MLIFLKRRFHYHDLSQNISMIRKNIYLQGEKNIKEIWLMWNYGGMEVPS